MLNSALFSDADFQRVANNVIAFPEGISTSEFWQDPFSYGEVLQLSLDTDALWAQLEAEVNPARRELVRLMGAHRYLTRLYSTLSPEEMTLDPEFTFNPDMTEDVSNVRTIEVTIACDNTGAPDESAATLVNSAGETVTVDLSGANSIRRENGELIQGLETPASTIIEVTRERGAPTAIDPPQNPTDPDAEVPEGDGNDAGFNWGCTTQSDFPSLPIILAMIALFGIRRSRLR